jgi:hypothetical protein
MSCFPKLGKTLLFCCLALLLAAPGFGQPIIKAGTDLLQTLGGNGTIYSFANDPIPADFFCSGSAPFTGAIQLKGIPVLTKPAGIAGNADTIVERLADADLTFGQDSVPATVRAMSLDGMNVITIACGSGARTFSVRACTCGEQPITKMNIRLDDPSCGCGSYDGELALNICLTFTDLSTGDEIGPLKRTVQLFMNKSGWCEKPGFDGAEIADAYHVTTVCGFEDFLAVSATSNFHPGWDCASSTSGDSCLDLYGHLTSCHSSFGQADHDHCINPVCCDSKGISCRN